MTSTLFLCPEGNFLEPLDSQEGSSRPMKEAGLDYSAARGNNYHLLGFFGDLTDATG